MNVVIYGALYRDNGDGKCKKAGAGFRLIMTAHDQKVQKDFEVTSADRSYGDLWLSELLSRIDAIDTYMKLGKDERDEDVESIKLITNQIEAGKMAGKIERILIDALSRGKESEADIEHLVFKDGRYSTRPNNHLYSKLVFKLVAMHKNGIRFSQDHLPSVHTMDLVKSLQKSIAPNKPLIIRPKPKREKAPL